MVRKAVFVLIYAGIGVSFSQAKGIAETPLIVPGSRTNPRFIALSQSDPANQHSRVALTSPVPQPPTEQFSSRRRPSLLPKSEQVVEVAEPKTSAVRESDSEWFSSRRLPSLLPNPKQVVEVVDESQSQFGQDRPHVLTPMPERLPKASVVSTYISPPSDVPQQEELRFVPEISATPRSGNDNTVVQTHAEEIIEAEPLLQPEVVVGEPEYQEFAEEGNHYLPYPRVGPPPVFQAPYNECDAEKHCREKVLEMVADKYDLAHRSPHNANWVVQNRCGKVVRRFVDVNNDGVLDLVCEVYNGCESCRDINDFSGLPSVQDKTGNYYIPGQETNFDATPPEFIKYGVPRGSSSRF